VGGKMKNGAKKVDYNCEEEGNGIVEGT